MATIVSGSVEILGNGASVQQLSPSNVPLKHICIQRKLGSTGEIAVGDTSVSQSNPDSGILAKSDPFDINGECPVAPSSIGVRGTASGDKLLWTGILD